MRTLTGKTIGYINLFESLTKARVKGCYEGTNRLTFIVYEGEAGKAIGKGGQNIKRLEGLLKKKIKVLEFNPDVVGFIENLIYPIKAKIYIEENRIVIEGKGIVFKKAVLGKQRQNLKELQDIVSTYFNYEINVK